MPALFLLPDLFLSAYARPPDLQTEAVVRPGSTLSGPLVEGGREVLVWVEQDTDLLYVTELIEGQLLTRPVGEDASSLTALLDYDGDGQTNILGSHDGIRVDLETRQEFDILTCHLDGIGDINGDGFDDLTSPFEAWLGSPTGFSAGGVLYADEDVVGCPTIYSLGDLDADGRGDFARASVNGGAPFYLWPEYSPLDMYLGADYDTPVWSPYWRYQHPTEGAGRAVTTADIDGDGQDELFLLAGHDVDGATRGELQMLDDILDPLGPTVLRSEDIGWYIGNQWGMSLQNMGDLDGDGDDEVLSVMEEDLDGTLFRILDAEPDAVSLFEEFGDSFELPLPAGLDDGDTTSRQLLVGDYDGNGARDVALVMAWTTPEDEYTLVGSISLWLSPAVEVVPGEQTSDTAAPPGLLPVPDTLDPPVGYSCGCGATGPSGGSWWPLLLGLPLLSLRRHDLTFHRKRLGSTRV